MVKKELPRAQVFVHHKEFEEEFDWVEENLDTNVDTNRRHYTLGMLHMDHERYLDRIDEENYSEIGEEFNDLIDNCFVVFCDFKVQSQGWEDFLNEFETLMNDYFVDEWGWEI